MCVSRFTGAKPSIHASGGFSAHAWQLNMVRDPSVLIDSAYKYHMKIGESYSFKALAIHQLQLFILLNHNRFLLCCQPPLLCVFVDVSNVQLEQLPVGWTRWWFCADMHDEQGVEESLGLKTRSTR